MWVAKDPAVDQLITKIIEAKNRKDLVSATRALDRVLMWNNYVVPQWYKGSHNIAYRNKFFRPAKPYMIWEFWIHGGSIRLKGKIEMMRWTKNRLDGRHELAIKI